MNARCKTAAQGERATIGCIEPNNGDVPFFRHVDGAAIPLRVVDGPSCPTWQEEMAREIFTPFAGDAAPLLRATLIHEANRAVFILAAHHTISDGVSMAAALCDLFHVLAGGTIELHPIIPPMEESLGVPRAQLDERLDAPPQSGPLWSTAARTRTRRESRL